MYPLTSQLEFFSLLHALGMGNIYLSQTIYEWIEIFGGCIVLYENRLKKAQETFNENRLIKVYLGIERVEHQLHHPVVYCKKSKLKQWCIHLLQFMSSWKNVHSKRRQKTIAKQKIRTYLKVPTSKQILCKKYKDFT